MYEVFRSATRNLAASGSNIRRRINERGHSKGKCRVSFALRPEYSVYTLQACTCGSYCIGALLHNRLSMHPISSEQLLGISRDVLVHSKTQRDQDQVVLR